MSASGQQGDRGQTGKKLQKDHIFFTLKPEKKVAGWFLGVASARRTGKAFGAFKETMLHGDQKHAYWVASMPQKDRDVLARRVSREAFIYISIGGILGISAFWDGISDGLAGKADEGLFWLLLGLLASTMGAWIGIVKLWQAHNVKKATHCSLMEFLNLSGHSDGGAHGS
ncbi:MAG: hypothetical protein M0Z50_16320 [Planctomycetia bacterium]|nr:hypothetical protein [Planctomycetia bacterium]